MKLVSSKSNVDTIRYDTIYYSPTADRPKQKHELDYLQWAGGRTTKQKTSKEQANKQGNLSAQMSE